MTRVETFLECKLTEEGSPVTVIHPGLENGFQTVVSAVSQRESIQLYLSPAKLKSRINRSADLKAEQIRLKKGLNERKSLHTEANSSIEYFNDNDETVLQGETQYKHAE